MGLPILCHPEAIFWPKDLAGCRGLKYRSHLFCDEPMAFAAYLTMPRMCREHRYFTYIMSSRTGVLYIGVSSDLEARVRQHKKGTFDGFTKRYKCQRLVYYEVYGYIQAAIGREKELKGWTRAKKITLIESMNPQWKDLSEPWCREFLVRGQSMKDADEARSRRIPLRLDGSSPK